MAHPNDSNWLTEKPERLDHRPFRQWPKSVPVSAPPTVWWNAGLIVALMVAFAWSLKSLAGW